MKKIKDFFKYISLKSAITILVALVCILFGLSYIQRSGHIGNIYANHRTIQDSSTFLYNWLKLGFANIHGRMLMEVPSYASPLGGTPYYSYPPGFLVLPYILCLIKGNEGTVSFLQHYTIVNHLILSLSISLIVLLLWIKNANNKKALGLFFAAAAGAVAIFSPGHYYYLSIEYFADYAVLAPIAVLLLLEAVRLNADIKYKKIIYALQAFFIFFTAFIDFLAYFFIFVIWLVRVIRGEYKSFKSFVIGTIKYVWPMLAAIALFFVYLYYSAGSLAPFIQRYSQRSSFTIGFAWLQRMKSWLFNVYGNTLMYALIISAAIFGLLFIGLFIVKRNKDGYRKIYGYGIIALASPLLNTILLPEHSFYHDFTVLRYIFPVTISTFAICPLLILMLSDSMKNIRKKILLKKIILAAMVILALFMGVNTYANRNAYFNNVLYNKFDFEPQKLIYEVSEFEDFVYITPEQLDMTYPPVYSRKQMHSVRQDINAMLEHSQNINANENVCILIVKNPEKPLSETPAYINDVTAQMEAIYTDDDFEYYRASKEEYISILENLIQYNIKAP